MKYYAIIVGGGSGTRMGTEIPKQFLLLKGKPVVMHTIQAFQQSDLKPEIILVLNVDFYPYWEKLCNDFNFSIPHQLVRGGTNRFNSVKNGLKAVKGKALVAIHDAVRPLVSNDLITRCYREAELNGNAVSAIPATDSVRKLTNGFSERLNRNEVFLVQTPQTFQSALLKKAYTQPCREEFTDDAAVVERAGASINLVAGEKLNFKLTFPEDLKVAELILNGH